MRYLLCVLCCLAGPSLAQRVPVLPSSCADAIQSAENANATAPGLLAAIGLVESGRTDPRTGRRVPWPWTVTAEGTGVFYGSKLDAMRAVQALQERGVTSIDVGCMQVNLLHHPAAFRTLADAFDPAVNASYAAGFLARLHVRMGDWMQAAAAYHSMTPGLAEPYRRLIASVWAGEAVPVAHHPGGVEVVLFPDGGQMRILRDAIPSGSRVMGLMSSP